MASCDEAAAAAPSDSEQNQKQQQQQLLRVLFIPILATGHMLPMFDIATLFADRGVAATVITTNGNAARVPPSLPVLLVPFPSAACGLPLGCEDSASAIAADPSGGLHKLYQGINLLQAPIRRLIHDHRPDCIVSDTQFPWTSDIAAELGIPRFVFNPDSAFSTAVSDAVEFSRVYADVAGDAEPFEVPIPAPGTGPAGNLPINSIKLTKLELSLTFKYPFILEVFRNALERSHGYILNTFEELEGPYVPLCRQVRKSVWCIGPVHLCHRPHADLAARGGGSGGGGGAAGASEILAWLDSKEVGSVLYVSFGSCASMSNAQLHEIAKGIEAAGRPFLWVVRGGNGGLETIAEWMPEGFEERMEEKGMVIKGWAPQVVILRHAAVGGFLSHCGWNSVMEATAAGVPMAVWPMENDQFMIERLMVEVAGTGIRFTAPARLAGGAVVEGEEVRKAIDKLMAEGDEEGIAVRRRAKEYGAAAKAAMAEGGSSYDNLSKLIEELTTMTEERKKKNYQQETN